MLHMCSIGFRSGDILDHSITFTFSSKAVVILAVCLGWLCWKTVSEGRTSSSGSECHSTCWNPCFASMNRSSPVPAVVMQPQTMMQPKSYMRWSCWSISWVNSVHCSRCVCVCPLLQVCVCVHCSKCVCREHISLLVILCRIMHEKKKKKKIFKTVFFFFFLQNR